MPHSIQACPSLLGLIVFAALWLLPAPARSAIYTVTDLGTLGGNSSQAASINAGGQVTGQSFTSSLEYHAFLYSGGTMIDLGT